MESIQESKISSNPIIIVLGMAGSGKTSFIESFDKYISNLKKKVLKVNLDPAVLNTKYKPDIDIRDSIKYKEVMKNHNLGPNGAIMTSLSIYCTRIGELVVKIQESINEYDFIIIDTPGQIEVFTCSAAGMIISRSLSSIAPTFITYIVDSFRCKNPRTFISNMLNSLSCMYKTYLPLMLVFNKTDLVSNKNHVKWMKDFEAFQEEVNLNSSYSGNLAISLSLALEEFYQNLNFAEVSCLTQTGFDDFVKNIPPLIEDFQNSLTYIPESLDQDHNKPKRSIEKRGEKVNFTIRPDI